MVIAELGRKPKTALRTVMRDETKTSASASSFNP